MTKYWICFDMIDYRVSTKEEFEQKLNDYALETLDRFGEIEVADTKFITWYTQGGDIVAYIEK